MPFPRALQGFIAAFAARIHTSITRLWGRSFVSPAWNRATKPYWDTSLPRLASRQAPLDQLLRLIHGHIFFHHILLTAVAGGPVKEGRPGPEGAQGHDPNAPAPQLPVHSPAEAQHKGLAGPVHVDIRDGLEGRHRSNIDDLPARGI